jgi:chemosensory pili system protein ChpA (sensor histidine kinase/response regulator)
MARLTHSYLRWIRPGLDELIQQAQVALEDHATQSNPERLAECLESLGRIHASLQMVQIYGIGLLLEEMLLLGQALQGQQVAKVDEALESLMGAMVVVSDRLDRIAQGEDDSPITMLGILNDLRACRDAPLMSSLSLFGGDLDQQIARLYASAGDGNPQMPRIAEKLRASFHKGLLHWLRHPDTKDGLILVQAVLDKFVEYAGAEPTRVFFSSLAALVQSLATNSLEAGVAVKRLMSRSDREIKLLADGGEAAFIQDPEPELFKSILYYVANSSSEDSRVTSTLSRFSLKSLHGIKADKETLAGVNQELLTAVSDALRDDLLQIKDGLDDFIKEDTQDLESLKPLHTSLVRLADTIGMLGQGGLRLELKQQSEKLADWIARSQAPQESELMDLAAKVINVELSLEQLSKFQGGTLNETTLPAFTRDELMIATLRESAIEIAHIKEQLGLYLEHPANGLPANIQGRFTMVLGALSMLQLAEPEAMLRFVADYVGQHLGGSELPPATALDGLADLLASIEYFMESISQELGLEETILAFARDAQARLESLGQQPDVAKEPETQEASLVETTAIEGRPSLEPLKSDAEVAQEVMPAAISQPLVEEPGLVLTEPEVSEAPESQGTEETLELQRLDGQESLEEPELVLMEPEEASDAVEQPGIEKTLETQPLDGQESLEEPELVLMEPEEASETVEQPGIEETLEIQPFEGQDSLEEPELVLMEPEASEEHDLILVESMASEPVASKPEVIESEGLETEASKADDVPSTLEIKAEQFAEADDIELLSLPESEHLIIEAVPAPAPVTAPPVPVAAPPSSIDDDVDSEILDIFLEEAEEEKDVILEQFPLWLANSYEDAALVRVRRAFHTLKGSGRLVGAQVLGDFAWSIENLLNKVLEGTIEQTEALKRLINEVLDILPAIIERERTRMPHPVESYEAISSRAFALAEGRLATGTSHVGTGLIAPDTAVAEAVDQGFLPFDESQALAEELAPPEDVLGQQDSLLYTTWGNEDPETLMIESRLVAEMEQVLAGGAGVVMPMDETLFRVFEPECRMHLKRIDILVSTGSASWLAADKATIIDALHTIAEGAHTTELAPIARIARACERCFVQIQGSALSVSLQDMKLLARTSDIIDQLLGIINKNEASMPEWRPLLVDLESRLVQLEVEASAVGSHHHAEAGAAASEIDSRPWSRSADDTTFINEDPFLEAMGMTSENQDTPVAGLQLPESAPPPLEMNLPDEPMANLMEDFIPEDPELLEIFLEEAQELGERLDVALQDWLLNTEDSSALDELKRVLHTLKGASRLAGVTQIGDLSHAYESFFIALEHGSLAHSEQINQIARQVADHILGQIETLADTGKIISSTGWLDILGAAQRGEFSGQGRPAPLKGISTRTPPQQKAAEPAPEEHLVAEAPTEVQPEPASAADPVVLDPLAEIASMEQALKALEDPVPLIIKTDVEDLSLEDELKVLQDLENLSKSLASPTESPSENGGLSLEDELKALEGLDDLGEPSIEPSPAAPEPRPEPPPPAPRFEQSRPEPPKPAPSKPEVAKPPQEERPAPAAARPRAASRFGQAASSAAESQAKQELIRVRADRLDQMVNNAGEISIFRARIEQQSGIIGFNLDELYQTLYRMRNQLRRLEIETEAQIQFRYDQVKEESAGPDAAFDPLEMDRFSSMQQISRALAETLDDLVNLNETMVETNRTTETLLLQQSRVNNDLQDSLLRTRMVSFSQAVPRLQRLVRQTAQTLGKKAELQVHGGGGELDRSILDRILAPLEHILRNALSHGIETPQERQQAGKAMEGQIVLSLLREGKDMLIRIEDDGAGINTQAIRRKAIERGLLDADAEVSEDELIQFLLESGFSTASQVSQVAGRGVGMDVVISEVKQLGGVLDISSNQGKGSRFDIRLPFTLSLTETLLVGVGEDIFAVPHTSIEGVIRMSREQLEACYLGAQEGVSYAGNAYRVHYLAELLGFVETGGNYFPEERKWYPMLLVRHGELRVAIHADRMLGSRQIVVKSVGAQLSTVRWITGGTILADGRVALILDVTTLVRLAVRSQAKILRPGEDTYRAIPVAEKAPAPKATVMVVDDSVTVRKVTSRLLSRNNLNAITAKDGVDALGQLQDVIPDLMLLDIEMPRMDGYELTRHIRHDEKLKQIPIIMITSRTGDKHRQMALELGVNLYLGKPFQEAELLESIRSLLPEDTL